ncbi:MAG: diaminopropionate ammonia-lyase [Selenomonadaceae bacterium]|nr:diaminopropionate ammonia-lyase [Selenomonadaceae bacterium]
MSKKILLATNKNRGADINTSAYSFANTDGIRNLHIDLDCYNMTPLVSLKNFAAANNVRAVLVKDESTRFGLKAFKGLGSIYAIYKVISRKLGLFNPPLKKLLSRRDEFKDMTFITTTDGNHGKGVSWAANLFGCKSFVYMPKGTVEIRAQAIRDAGNATVEITDLSYDDCVKFTAELAAKNHWYLIQDTSWRGYEEIPAQIMLGYSTLAYEALWQMEYKCPTHIFLQAGVGSMAGAIAAVFCEVFRSNPPRITIVEPAEVACFYESMKVGDGQMHSATGTCKTMMAGLNCATPCEIAWYILRRFATDAAAIDDEIAAEAMKQLANPIGDDEKIISGESGCAGFALANAALKDEDLRRALEIDSDSVIFVVNTEGATDPDNYSKIVNGQTLRR